MPYYLFPLKKKRRFKIFGAHSSVCALPTTSKKSYWYKKKSSSSRPTVVAKAFEAHTNVFFFWQSMLATKYMLSTPPPPSSDQASSLTSIQSVLSRRLASRSESYRAINDFFGMDLGETWLGSGLVGFVAGRRANATGRSDAGQCVAGRRGKGGERT